MNSIAEDLTLDAISQIINTQNALDAYLENLSYLDDCRVITFDGENTTNFIDHDICTQIGNYYIIGIGDYSKTLSWNKNCLKKMTENKSGATYLKVESCIYFDGNIASSLRAISNGGSFKDNTFLKLLSHIKTRQCQCDCYPYIVESAYNIGGMDSVLPLYNALRSSFAFSRISEEDLRQNNFSTFSFQTEDYLYADDALREMRRIKQDDKPMIQILAIQSLLLQTLIIQKEYSDMPFEFKIGKLIEFIGKESVANVVNALYLCAVYLGNSQDRRFRRFFGKLNSVKEKIIKNIENTAWDLFHLSSLQQNMAKRSSDDHVHIGYLVSEDIGLRSVAQYNPVERIVLYKNTAYPKYRHDIKELLNERLIKVFEDSLSGRKRNLSESEYRELVSSQQVRLHQVFK